MDLKQFIIDKLSLFFMLTTFITIAIFVLGSVFDASASFGYDALLSPLMYAGACILPSFVTYSRHELNAKEMAFRLVLEFFLIEAVVLGIAFAAPTVDTGNVYVVLALAGTVLVIYVVACLFSWLKEMSEAKRMTEALVKFQSTHQK